jgi:hypothetical protein
MAFLSKFIATGPLTHLSLTRDGTNPTNAERLRQFRECVPPALHNPYPWPYLLPKRAGTVVPIRRRA